jgi:drug/metabolite transporter (DMT)-like permease
MEDRVAGGFPAYRAMQTKETIPLLRTETPAGLVKTRELTIFVIVTQVIGNVALSRGMRGVGLILPFSLLPYLHAILSPWVIGGVVVLACWMLFNLTLLSRADLSYVLPVTAISYVLIPIVGHFVLRETISLTRWMGTAMITLGVMIVGRTPTRTVPDVLEPDVLEEDEL